MESIVPVQDEASYTASCVTLKLFLPSPALLSSQLPCSYTLLPGTTPLTPQLFEPPTKAPAL